MHQNKRRRHLHDAAITAAMLGLTTLVGIFFDSLGFKDINVYTEFILGILIVALLTASRLYSALASVFGIMIFNFLFAEPRMSLLAVNYGYPLDLIVILVVGLVVATLARTSERMSFRTRTLLATDQLFLQASGEEQIIAITAQQLLQLLERPLVFFMADEDQLGAAQCFGNGPPLLIYDTEAAAWAYRTGKDSGRFTAHSAQASYTYMIIRTANHTLGVAGAAPGAKKPLSEMELELMRSVLSECALTLERDYFDRKRQEAAMQMRNEKLRADLLRSISHDLRTPLTSISGNADLLSDPSVPLTAEQKQRLISSIGEDAQWLLGTVENLLSVTRIEDGCMALRLQPEMISDVIHEAITHTARYARTHSIRCTQEDDMLMAQMDARLIVQVLVNLIDNAAKYTLPGSEIVICAQALDGRIQVSVADNGPGIPDAHKAEIFNMFYTTSSGSIDGRRGLGLGLSLCKAIINAHGGEITVTDNTPQGAVFTFTLTEERILLP